MKKGKSILTRCLALALALVLIVSSANLGAVLKVFAAEQKTVKVSELVVNNYDLTDAEKELILSGNLVDQSIAYTAFNAAEVNVTVDTATKTITAPNYNGWVPAKVELITSENADVTITNEGNGVYKHNYAGNAYSVKVTYKLDLEADVAIQTAQLNAAAVLKHNLANQASAAKADVSGILLAMESLEKIANDEVKVELPGYGSIKVTFKHEATKNAVKAMAADVKANGGKLSLQVLQEGYNAAASKTEYLREHGEAFKKAADDTYGWLVALNNPDDVIANTFQDETFQTIDNATYLKIAALRGILDSSVAALKPSADAEWGFVDNYLVAVPNYTVLDKMIDAEISNPIATAKSPLFFGNAEKQVDLSMKNVNVAVVQKDVTGEANSAALKVINEANGKKTLAEGAAAADVNAAINAIVADAIKDWDVTNAVSDLTPVTAPLTEDLFITVTYSPKELTISSNYAEDMKVPYGYVLQFADHTDASKSYDYKVGTESYIQGEELVVTENIEITRTEGRAYTKLDLYTQVGLHFGNKTAQDILSSGALLGNENIFVRMPSNGDKLLVLQGGNLTASVPAFDPQWAPYTYGDGKNMTEFAGTAYWAADDVTVVYKRSLADKGYTADDTATVLALAETLQNDANGQLAALKNLYAGLEDMAMLNGSILAGLPGVIGTVDFFPGNADKNAAMQQLFKDSISGISAESIDKTNNKLKLYNMLSNGNSYYEEGKDGLLLEFYYKNSTQIRDELTYLAGYLNDMLKADANFTAEEKLGALETLCALDIGMDLSGYKDQIVTLQADMNEGLENLKAPNGSIDLTSANVTKLTAALAQKGTVEKKTGVPFIVSSSLTATDSSKAQVIVTLVGLGEEITVKTPARHFGEKLTAAELEQAAADIEAAASNALGEKKPYYNVVKSQDVVSLVGTELTADGNIEVTYTYAPKTYTVKVEGVADQIVTAENLYVNLPAYPGVAMVYKYFLNGVEVPTGTYEFELTDLNTKFPGGVCTFTRTVDKINESNLDTVIAALNDNTSGNVYTTVEDAEQNTIALKASIVGSKDGIMSFVMDFVMDGYQYIGLNGKDLLYKNEQEELEVSIQTMIDAILADTSFSNETLIALGNNNGGKLLTATMQLGNDKDALHFENLEFTLELNGVPGKMATVSKGLDVIKNNIAFQSAGDYVNVDLHLPEKVYEVYLTAMWGIGELDKSNINAINNQIAFNFLYDYIMLIAESDVDAETFQNTLQVFDAAANAVLDKDIPDYDLTQYDKYLQLVKKALTSEGIKVNADEKTTSISIEGQGKHILTLVDAIGLDISSYEPFLTMVKELKEGNTLKASMKATLDNFDTNFEALILDANAAYDGAKEIKNIQTKEEAIQEAKDLGKGLGLANAIDYVSDLSVESQTSGKSYVFLLDDIEDTVVFNNTTILDLNGKDINSIVANGHVYIMDSTLDTLNAGTVGSVSGNVTIIAGNYSQNGSAYLPDGYKQVGTNVQNALYTIESLNNGDLNFTVNTDVMHDESVNGYLPTIRGLAVDIASDIALNYYMTAMMAIDGNEIANIDFDDVVGIIERTETATEAINEILCMFNAPGTSAFINSVSDDLLDFAAIESAINSGEKVASYDVTIAPYGIELYRNAEGNYLTFNVGSVDSKAWTFEVSLTLEGENKDKIAKVAGELDSIVDAEGTFAHIYLDQPYYSNRTLWLSGSGEASLSLDLSKEAKFQTIIAVILAYGNSDKADALVEAIGDENALKEIFNDISVEEVFTALKALEREVSFADMAKSLNVQVDYADAAAYENYFHLLMSALGYALEVLDITGYTNKTMGMIEVDDSGRYTLSYSPDAHGDITRRGFTVDATAVVEEITLSVKIFHKVEEEPDCLWGDVNHDDLVDARDACLILQYEVREGDLSLMEYDGYFCLEKADVTGDGEIDARDACLILQRDVNPDTVFPVEE